MKHSIIILFLLALLLYDCQITFGQTDKPPSASKVNSADSSDYDANPKGKYELIIIALHRFLLVDSLVKHQDKVIVCLDRYNISAEEIKEVLDLTRLPGQIGTYRINYLRRKGIIRFSEDTKKPIRFVLITEIIDYHFAARICLTSKLQLPRRIKNFSDKEYSVLYEYQVMGTNFQFLPERSQEGWELVER